jgi:hypothetical protein
VVGGVAVPGDRLSGIVIPDSVGKCRASRCVLAVQMAHAELARLLQVLVNHQQRRVPTVLRGVSD